MSKRSVDDALDALSPEDEFAAELEAARRLRGAKRDVVRVAAPPDEPPAIGRTHLVIGDAHCEPGQSWRRFRWLGRMIRNLAPDVVIDIGDWWSMDSLSGFEDRASLSFAGRRYWKDIDAGVACREAVTNEIARGKHRPELHHTQGNHEYRQVRLASAAAHLEGVFQMADFRLEEQGWKFHEYLRPAVIDGIHYSHYFTQPKTDKPIANLTRAKAVHDKKLIGGAYGHTHEFDYWEWEGLDRTRRCVVNVGCFFEDTPAYIKGGNTHNWRRGITVLRNVQGGSFDVEWWSMDRVRKAFG